jgi:hypothetical protein
MRRSAKRRGAAPTQGSNRRLLATGAVIAALGVAVGFSTISNAAENDRPAGSGAGKVVNGQTILTDTCVDSRLAPHTGFQLGDKCVSTEFGEVSSAANNSSLLITQAPRVVGVNTPFTLRVSTRNLIRDRFLAAGQGGYYVESSVLRNGIVRGHFHTACRMLPNTREAPDPSPVPAFFLATEDQRGGRAPDTVTINVPGMPTAGTAQCASWAGDGSHRIPMMERANETPAIDAVRITVRAGGAQQGGGQQAGGQQGGNQQGGNQQGGNQQGGNNNAGQNQQPATNTTTQPSTKTTVQPKPTTTAKAVTPKSTTTSAAPAAKSDDDSDAQAAQEVTPEQTKAAAKPKATSSEDAEAAGATDYTYSNEDGQLNSGEKVTAVDKVSSNSDKQGGLLALTGSNSMAVIGVAVVLMLVGLTLMALTRKRRPGTPWE